jgi:hypothetical protein
MYVRTYSRVHKRAHRQSSHLTGLILTENALAGRIPSAIGQLLQVKHLDLSGNKLIGACIEDSLSCNWQGEKPLPRLH